MTGSWLMAGNMDSSTDAAELFLQLVDNKGSVKWEHWLRERRI
jgi:hypothetical protein